MSLSIKYLLCSIVFMVVLPLNTAFSTHDTGYSGKIIGWNTEGTELLVQSININIGEDDCNSESSDEQECSCELYRLNKPIEILKWKDCVKIREKYKSDQFSTYKDSIKYHAKGSIAVSLSINGKEVPILERRPLPSKFNDIESFLQETNTKIKDLKNNTFIYDGFEPDYLIHQKHKISGFHAILIEFFTRYPIAVSFNYFIVKLANEESLKNRKSFKAN